MGEQRSDQEGGQMHTGRRRGVWLVGCVVLLLVVAPFIPLLLELIEATLFRTHFTARAARELGVFETLGHFYEWLGLVD